MNESTTRPDCPVGPDESPTLVTWCDGCGAADIRSDADLLDGLCRYCGGDVKRRRFPSRHAAKRFYRALQTATRNGTEPTRRRERDACMTRTHYERGSMPACGAVGEPVTSDLAVVDCAPCLEIGCLASSTSAARVASFEDVTRLPQNDRTDGLPAGSGELPDVEIILSPCRPGIGGRVRGAAIKAVSPAERGRSAATRLDGGEHRCRLSAIRQGRRRALTWRSRSPLLG